MKNDSFRYFIVAKETKRLIVERKCGKLISSGDKYKATQN